MHPIVNLTELPDTPWITWDHEVHHSFIQDRHFWEHPGTSPLAKETRLDNYGTLDIDSDHFLTRMCLLWSEDILTRRDHLDDDLVNAAEEFDSTRREVLRREGIFQEACQKIIPEEDYRGISFEEYNDKMNNATKEKKARKESFNDLESARERYVDTVGGLCSAIVVSEYSYGATRLMNMICDDIEERIAKEKERGDMTSTDRRYPEFDRKRLEDYRANITETLGNIDDFIMFLYLAECYESEWGKEDRYTLSLIAEPGVNLPHYVHDELLFMNHIQGIVDHDIDREKEVLYSGALTGHDHEEVISSFTKVIDGAGGWWT